MVRTINGVMANTVTVSATQGEKVTVEYSYIGQNSVSRENDTTILFMERWNS